MGPDKRLEMAEVARRDAKDSLQSIMAIMRISAKVTLTRNMLGREGLSSTLCDAMRADDIHCRSFNEAVEAAFDLGLQQSKV